MCSWGFTLYSELQRFKRNGIGSYKEVYEVFPLDVNTWKERLKYFHNLKAGTKVSLGKSFVWFVIFKNINNSQSIKTVDLENFTDKSSKVFNKFKF